MLLCLSHTVLSVFVLALRRLVWETLNPKSPKTPLKVWGAKDAGEQDALVHNYRRTSLDAEMREEVCTRFGVCSWE